MRFIGCTHATTLDLAHLRGIGPAPRPDSEDAVLLQRHGDAHERRHLESLVAEGRRVVEIPRTDDLEAGVAATRTALAAGPDVVYQGALRSDNWGGWSDFLERVDRPSDLGSVEHKAWKQTFVHDLTAPVMSSRPNLRAQLSPVLDNRARHRIDVICCCLK